ncbi:MFS transporter [Corynebacterium mastitidis]|uniref:MFS transporter n=1 Tax=Corynebacterium mastitidis TaxID=161890 RepID=UPI0030E9373D
MNSTSSKTQQRGENTNPWLVLTALCVGFFLVMVDQTIVAVATPDMKVSLDASYNEVIWFVSSYLLTFCAPLLLFGRIGAQVGLRAAFLAGLIIFTLGSLLCGLSETPTHLIAARAVQGLGSALILPQSMTIITRVFPADSRGKAMGVWGSVAGVGSLVGPLAGGLILEWTSWNWIFFVNVPVGIVATFLVLAWVPSIPGEPGGRDLPGAILSVAGLALLVYGLQEGEVRDWDTTVFAIIVAGVILLGIFIAVEFKSTDPLLPLHLFRYNNFGKASVAIATMGFGITGFAVPFMLYAQSVRQWSPIEAGLMILPMAVAAAVLAPAVGNLVDTKHPALVAVIGYLAMSLGSFWLGGVLDTSTSLWVFISIFVVLGIGNAFVWAPTSTVALRDVPDVDSGIGSGVYNTFRQLGAVIGSAATGALLQNRLAGIHAASDVAHDSSRAFGESIYLSAAVFIIGIAAVLLFRRRAAPNTAGASPAQ